MKNHALPFWVFFLIVIFLDLDFQYKNIVRVVLFGISQGPEMILGKYRLIKQ